jgi:hypothetical protein
MNSRQTIKLRMITDFVLLGIFGFVVPPVLAPLARNWPLLLAAFVTLLISIGFWLDGLRSLQRLRSFDPN